MFGKRSQSHNHLKRGMDMVQGDCKHAWKIGKTFRHHSCKTTCNIGARCKKCGARRIWKVDCFSCFKKYGFCGFIWFQDPHNWGYGTHMMPEKEREDRKKMFLELMDLFKSSSKSERESLMRCVASCGNKAVLKCATRSIEPCRNNVRVSRILVL